MKGSSDLYPEIKVISNNKIQLRFNIVPFTREIMNSTQSGFNYEYIELEEIKRDKIIDKIISEVYSKDKELALINNEINSPGTIEYTDYQTFRANAKLIADTFSEFY